MDIIIVGTRRNRTWRLHLGTNAVALAIGASTLLAAALVTTGYHLQPRPQELPQGLLSAWADEIRDQHQHLNDLRTQMGTNSQALSRRLAELQARVIRLDAAGSRLTQMAGLDPKEFDFTTAPPQGGPEEPDVAAPSLNVEQSLAELDAFEATLGERERRLRVVEDLLMANRLQREVHPSGWPIADGWISSLFGMRNDPFTGRRAFHSGIDFAGTPKSGVQAVAGGIVTDAGERYGYGQLVEINHGNGYVTRYGHNAKILVKAGDQVKKGERIALMGDTGRATGPHVHFEVLLNGVVVDPQRYIEAAR
ncbi:MAG TPA: peptidoglycan DD-metalloendopeptidase family protein [Nevskiaceae bacterium]|nr:peptidoglycan DD-metalloendopeptidase family protein [Nevskiaceae bacterium]